jgi:hypothetical protein
VWLQVNHLGPYTLTRMLEPKLIASKARVVNVVSVTHRLEKIRCTRQLNQQQQLGRLFQQLRSCRCYSSLQSRLTSNLLRLQQERSCCML